MTKKERELAGCIYTCLLLMFMLDSIFVREKSASITVETQHRTDSHPYAHIHTLVKALLVFSPNISRSRERGGKGGEREMERKREASVQATTS